MLQGFLKTQTRIQGNRKAPIRTQGFLRTQTRKQGQMTGKMKTLPKSRPTNSKLLFNVWRLICKCVVFVKYTFTSSLPSWVNLVSVCVQNKHAGRLKDKQWNYHKLCLTRVGKVTAKRKMVRSLWHNLYQARAKRGSPKVFLVFWTKPFI